VRVAPAAGMHACLVSRMEGLAACCGGADSACKITALAQRHGRRALGAVAAPACRARHADPGWCAVRQRRCNEAYGWAQVASQLRVALCGSPDIVIDCAGFESTLQVRASVPHKPALCPLCTPIAQGGLHLVFLSVRLESLW